MNLINDNETYDLFDTIRAKNYFYDNFLILINTPNFGVSIYGANDVMLYQDPTKYIHNIASVVLLESDVCKYDIHKIINFTDLKKILDKIKDRTNKKGLFDYGYNCYKKNKPYMFGFSMFNTDKIQFENTDSEIYKQNRKNFNGVCNYIKLNIGVYIPETQTEENK